MMEGAGGGSLIGQACSNPGRRGQGMSWAVARGAKRDAVFRTAMQGRAPGHQQRAGRGHYHSWGHSCDCREPVGCDSDSGGVIGQGGIYGRETSL